MKKLIKFSIVCVSGVVTVLAAVLVAHLATKFALDVSARALKASQDLPTVQGGEVDLFAFTFVTSLLSATTVLAFYLTLTKLYSFLKDGLNLLFEAMSQTRFWSKDRQNNEIKDRSKDKPTPKRSSKRSRKGDYK